MDDRRDRSRNRHFNVTSECAGEGIADLDCGRDEEK
jgi:hypothetical protein